MTPREVIAEELAQATHLGDVESKADSILSALKEAGYAVVRVEPNEQMVNAAISEGERQGVVLDDFSPPLYFGLVYLAMIAASQDQGRG